MMLLTAFSVSDWTFSLETQHCFIITANEKTEDRVLLGGTLASPFSTKLKLQLSLECRVEINGGSECSNKILQRYFRYNY